MLSPKTTDAEVLHGDTLVVSITINKRTTSPAAWMAFRICVSRDASDQVDTIVFQVRAQPSSAFRAKANNIEIDPLNERTIITKIKIKNNGNVYGRYYVSLVNEALRLNNHPSIYLKPGADTLYSCIYKVPAAAWKTFNSGDLHLTVTDSLFIKRQMPTSRAARQAMSSSSFSHNPYYETIPFAREDSVINEHVSAFPLMKIALETGYISYNGTSTYFAAIKGTLPVGNDSRIRFDYRSREYGLYNILDHDVYNIYFDSPHWRLHAGQVNDSRYFRTYGMGLSATYNWGGSTNNRPLAK